MLTLKALSFLLMICVAKSDVDFETMCKDNYRDLNNTEIDMVKYCSHNLCLQKCCCEDEIFGRDSTCKNVNVLKAKLPRFKHIFSQIDYSNITLSSRDGNTIKKTKKNDFIKNPRDVQKCTSERTNERYYILEDGSIKMQMDKETEGSDDWFYIKKSRYCIDFKIIPIKKVRSTEYGAELKLVVRQYHADPRDIHNRTVFDFVGTLISSFFLLLVLVVYCLLPSLRNLIGLVLMAYVFSILVAFIVKAVIYITDTSSDTTHCKFILSPLLYFGGLSSFFWLNVMSFDVWWSLRGYRKRCEINRRGEVVKFMWYCLYAWGTPLLITAIVVTLDNVDNLRHIIVKPPFDNCFAFDDGIRIRVYFGIPIGVIISVNIALFIMTVYNIMMIKRALHNSQDSRNTKQQTNRFGVYIKLSVIMGVSWCLELMPPNTELWVYILTTTYNLLIGVAIFFLFVFKKRILIMMCKRFHIQKNFVNKLESSQRTTRTTGISRTKDQDLDISKNCPKGERVDV